MHVIPVAVASKNHIIKQTTTIAHQKAVQKMWQRNKFEIICHFLYNVCPLNNKATCHNPQTSSAHCMLNRAIFYSCLCLCVRAFERYKICFGSQRSALQFRWAAVLHYTHTHIQARLLHTPKLLYSVDFSASYSLFLATKTMALLDKLTNLEEIMLFCVIFALFGFKWKSLWRQNVAR